jgi:hypothetical protein
VNHQPGSLKSLMIESIWVVLPPNSIIGTRPGAKAEVADGVSWDGGYPVGRGVASSIAWASARWVVAVEVGAVCASCTAFRVRMVVGHGPGVSLRSTPG